MGSMSFGELRAKAVKLGIDVKGKRPAELEKEIAKKEAPTAPAKAAKAAPKAEAPAKKEAPVKSEVVIDFSSLEHRIVALEAANAALAASVIHLTAALQAVGDEIGFELPKIGETQAAAEAPKEEGKKRGRPRKQAEEPAPAAEEEEEAEEAEEEDEAALEISAEEIEKASYDRLVEISETINAANGPEKIEIVKNVKKLRAAVLAWLEAHGEKLVEDETEAAETEEADDSDDEDEAEDDSDEEDEDEEDEAVECPDYCKKGAAIEVCFNAENGVEEWMSGTVLKVEEASADVMLEDSQIAEVPFDSMRLPAPKKVKLSAKGSKKK